MEGYLHNKLCQKVNLHLSKVWMVPLALLGETLTYCQRQRRTPGRPSYYHPFTWAMYCTENVEGSTFGRNSSPLFFYFSSRPSLCKRYAEVNSLGKLSSSSSAYNLSLACITIGSLQTVLLHAYYVPFPWKQKRSSFSKSWNSNLGNIVWKSRLGKNQLFIQKFTKFDTWKMWILWKMRVSKCEFCDKWDVENVNFWINWSFLP